jgi:hypothetical protein
MLNEATNHGANGSTSGLGGLGGPAQTDAHLYKRLLYALTQDDESPLGIACVGKLRAAIQSIATLAGTSESEEARAIARLLEGLDIEAGVMLDVLRDDRG